MKLGRLAVLLYAIPLLASDPPAKKPLTPEVAITMRSQADLHFSPDGRRAVAVVGEPLAGTTRKRHIWMLDVETRKLRQFTFSEKSDSSPRWSPDGRTLAFLSNRSDQSQIYLLSMDGGEAYAITEGKRSVQGFEWSPDGRQIAFIAPDPKGDDEEKKEKDKDDARVIDKDDKPAGVWIFDMESRKTRRVIQRPWRVTELAWLPSNDHLIVVAEEHPDREEEVPRIYNASLSDGKMAQLAAPAGPFHGVKVSPDGKWIAYIGCRVDGPSPHDLYALPASGGQPTNLTSESIDRLIGNFAWTGNDGITATIEDGFHSRMFRVSLDGKATAMPPVPVNPRGFDVARNGTLVFSGSSSTQPEELWLAAPGAAPAKVSEFNKSWDAVQLIKPEVFRYRSFDGAEIEAALLLPAGYDGHSRLPLITLVHGGPTGLWSDSIQNWAQILAGHGYAVMCPNIRGSLGYGQKFMEMNRADWGGGDFKDVMAGIDALVARGVADPDRLGIGGWSYGGYMAEWAITQTNRFKAAISGAGMADLISEFGTETSPSYDAWFFGQPYEKPEGFLHSSPLMYMKNARTPTLILQGENDTTDPLGQSQQLYRALKHYGVRAELVQYPREPHGPQEEKHNIDILKRIVAWYDEYLKAPAASAAGQ
ncbi:MAG: S9 family peptidase [Acidobacteria bacterium]|nr:S9 family peptidase [Acidobacteriota bacterium]